MMTYNNELIGIPGVIMTSARSREPKPSFKQVERVSGQSAGSLLGSRFIPSRALRAKEPLFIQMRIAVFLNGDEREIDQLWSHAGPVSSKKDATAFMRMDKAVERLAEISRTKTMEYRVVSAEIRNESSVTVGAMKEAA